MKSSRLRGRVEDNPGHQEEPSSHWGRRCADGLLSLSDRRFRLSGRAFHFPYTTEQFEGVLRVVLLTPLQRPPLFSLRIPRGSNIVIKSIRAFVADESGAIAIEYALTGSLIAIALVTVLTSLGTRLSSEFSEVSSVLK
jgi:pilus assembly protein Flp/PilA